MRPLIVLVCSTLERNIEYYCYVMELLWGGNHLDHQKLSIIEGVSSG